MVPFYILQQRGDVIGSVRSQLTTICRLLVSWLETLKCGISRVFCISDETSSPLQK